jgi:hypothetical protein
VPDYRWVKTEDINADGMLAVWQKPTPNKPNGVVDLDRDHPVIRSQVEYWQKQYPKSVHRDIEQLVMDAYGEVAVAKVSHMHALTGTIFSEEQRDDMLANPALTTSMLGLISEDALIAPRTGKLGTKRLKDADAAA